MNYSNSIFYIRHQFSHSLVFYVPHYERQDQIKIFFKVAINDEDEFDNYNYEKGAYTEIPISWNNASRKLTIGARKGAYEGMLKNRKFTVTLQDGTQKSVDYSGKAVSVKF